MGDWLSRGRAYRIEVSRRQDWNAGAVICPGPNIHAPFRSAWMIFVLGGGACGLAKSDFGTKGCGSIDSYEAPT